MPVVAPPKVPSNYAANYPQGHPRAQEQFNNQRRSSGYSTLPMNIPQQQQHLINNSNSHPQQNNYSVGPHHTQMQTLSNVCTTPPLPPMPNLSDQSPISDSLPLPPFHQQIISNNSSITNNNLMANPDRHSPPLPSPPAMDDSIYNPSHNSSIIQNNNDWMPKEYVEKVIALYDYNASRNDELSFKENSTIYVSIIYIIYLCK